MLRVIRPLERRERFFKLSEEFGQSGQFFLGHEARPQYTPVLRRIQLTWSSVWRELSSG